MTQDTSAVRLEVVTVCRRLYERGLIAGQDGNVSVRIAPRRILVTPPGRSKVDVTERDLVELSLDEPVRGSVSAGRAVSSEVQMHVRIYEERADVHAVVHAHPPTATAFSVAGESLAPNVLPEAIFNVGDVALVPYATPGTAGLGDSLVPFLADHDAFLLAQHGATTIGATLTIAHQRMESLEHSARILFAARLLGRVNTLTPGQVQELRDARALAYPKRADALAGHDHSATQGRSESSTTEGGKTA